jgi:hypothetical protein
MGIMFLMFFEASGTKLSEVFQCVRHSGNGTVFTGSRFLENNSLKTLHIPYAPYAI